MGKAIYVSNLSNYTTDRAYNMVRHLKNKHDITTSVEDEDFFNHCTQWESESAYFKHLALSDRNKAPKKLDMDLSPYFSNQYFEILEQDGIYAKLRELEKEIEHQKYEQVLTKMFGNQLTYNDGWVSHIGGELQPSDTQYYNLYMSVVNAYGWMLYKLSSLSKGRGYREEICQRTNNLHKNPISKTKLIKRIKDHIVDTMS